MSTKHTEARFEEAIDYNVGPDQNAFDRGKAFDPSRVLRFIEATQPIPWTALTQADQLFFDQIEEEAIENEHLQKSCRRQFQGRFSWRLRRSPSRDWSSTAWKATKKSSTGL